MPTTVLEYCAGHWNELSPTEQRTFRRRRRLALVATSLLLAAITVVLVGTVVAVWRLVD